MIDSTDDFTALVFIYIPHDNQMIEVEPHWNNILGIASQYSFIQISYDEYIATVDIATLKAMDDAFRHDINDTRISDAITAISTKYQTQNISIGIQIVTHYYAEIIRNSPRYL